MSESLEDYFSYYCQINDIHSIIVLLNSHVNFNLINSRNLSGWRPLHIALYNKNNDLLRLLLSEGACPDINQLYENNIYGIISPIKLSIYMNNEIGLQYLLRSKIDIYEFKEQITDPKYLNYNFIKDVESVYCVPENYNLSKNLRSFINKNVYFKEGVINFNPNFTNFSQNNITKGLNNSVNAFQLACIYKNKNIIRMLINSGASLDIEIFKVHGWSYVPRLMINNQQSQMVYIPFPLIELDQNVNQQEIFLPERDLNTTNYPTLGSINQIYSISNFNYVNYSNAYANYYNQYISYLTSLNLSYNNFHVNNNNNNNNQDN